MSVKYYANVVKTIYQEKVEHPLFEELAVALSKLNRDNQMKHSIISFKVEGDLDNLSKSIIFGVSVKFSLGHDLLNRVVCPDHETLSLNYNNTYKWHFWWQGDTLIRGESVEGVLKKIFEIELNRLREEFDLVNNAYFSLVYGSSKVKVE